MFAKFISRKLIVALLTGIVDYLVATGQLSPELKELLITVITAIGGGYITVEGVKDIAVALKS